jgi:predicted pyridoxine 5'-phosphate oxidase superfamily flavin-nucleotide-binding protein
MSHEPGWSTADSPFHLGEQRLQESMGVRERIESIGRRVVRNFMPDEHRAFFAELPFLVVGTLDEHGQPWASIINGEPGFVSAPDGTTLQVKARPQANDPFARNLRVGADIGLLGIEFATRRRNRTNGLISKLGEDGFDIAVKQSFGNCPKYIQARDLMPELEESSASGVAAGSRLGAAERELIAQADTFFIASALGSLHQQASQGIDASHRGGKAGFVRIDDEHTLTVPDFAGNNAFNTLGNLLLNPRCGLLFLDFATGTTVQLAADAEIIAQSAEIARFAGAQRILRFHVRESLRCERIVPLRWRFRDYSPFLYGLGSGSGPSTKA